MLSKKYSVNIARKIVSLFVLGAFMFGDVAWALPRSSERPEQATLAPYSRLAQFFTAKDLDLKHRASVIYAAGSLKKLFVSQTSSDTEIQREIVRLNRYFEPGTVRLDEEIYNGRLKGPQGEEGRSYRYLIFNFTKESAKVRMLFLPDHSLLTPDELAQLGIDDNKRHHLDCPGLEGVWFVSDGNGSANKAQLKSFNVELSGAGVPYDQLEFLPEYDGVTLMSDGFSGDFRTLFAVSQDHGALAENMRTILASGMALLTERAVVVQDQEICRTLCEGIMLGIQRHNGLVIRVAKNLPQNSCLFSDAANNRNVLVFNEEFLSDVTARYMEVLKLLDEANQFLMRGMMGFMQAEALGSRADECTKVALAEGMLLNRLGAGRGVMDVLRLMAQMYKTREADKELLIARLMGSAEEIGEIPSPDTFLWPLAERLNHEICSHSQEFGEPEAEFEEECECVYRDLLLLKYALMSDEKLDKSVRYNMKHRREQYRSTEYYRFLYQLAEAPAESDVRSLIRAYVLERFSFADRRKGFPSERSHDGSDPEPSPRDKYEITRRGVLKSIAAFCLSGNVDVLVQPAPPSLVDACMKDINSGSEAAKLLKLIEPTLQACYDAHLGEEGTCSDAEGIDGWVQLVAKNTADRKSPEEGNTVDRAKRAVQELARMRHDDEKSIGELNEVAHTLEMILSHPGSVTLRERARAESVIRKFAKFHADRELSVIGPDNRNNAIAALRQFGSFSLESRARVVLAVIRTIEVPSMRKIIDEHIVPGMTRLREIVRSAGSVARQPSTNEQVTRSHDGSGPEPSPSASKEQEITLTTVGLGEALAKIVSDESYPTDDMTIDKLTAWVDEHRPELFKGARSWEEKRVMICMGISASYPNKTSFSKETSESHRLSHDKRTGINKSNRCGMLFQEAINLLDSSSSAEIIVPPDSRIAHIIHGPFGNGYDDMKRYGYPADMVTTAQSFFELCISPEDRRYVARWEMAYVTLLHGMSAAELDKEWKRLHGRNRLYTLSVDEFIGDTQQVVCPRSLVLHDISSPYEGMLTSDDEERVLYHIARMDIYLEWVSRHWGRPLEKDISSIPKAPSLEWIKAMGDWETKGKGRPVEITFETSTTYAVLTQTTDDAAMRVLGLQKEIGTGPGASPKPIVPPDTAHGLPQEDRMGSASPRTPRGPVGDSGGSLNVIIEEADRALETGNYPLAYFKAQDALKWFRRLDHAKTTKEINYIFEWIDSNSSGVSDFSDKERRRAKDIFKKAEQALVDKASGKLHILYERLKTELPETANAMVEIKHAMDAKTLGDMFLHVARSWAEIKRRQSNGDTLKDVRALNILDEVIEQIADVICDHYSGIENPNKRMAFYLLCRLRDILPGYYGDIRGRARHLASKLSGEWRTDFFNSSDGPSNTKWVTLDEMQAIFLGSSRRNSSSFIYMFDGLKRLLGAPRNRNDAALTRYGAYEYLPILDMAMELYKKDRANDWRNSTVYIGFAWDKIIEVTREFKEMKGKRKAINTWKKRLDYVPHENQAWIDAVDEVNTWYDDLSPTMRKLGALAELLEPYRDLSGQGRDLKKMNSDKLHQTAYLVAQAAEVIRQARETFPSFDLWWIDMFGDYDLMGEAGKFLKEAEKFLADGNAPSAGDEAGRIKAGDRAYAPENVPAKTMICQIIPDAIIPAGQRNMIQGLEQYMKRPEHNYIERIVRLRTETPAEFMHLLKQEITRQRGLNPGYNIEFYVACPGTKDVKDILADKELGETLKVQALAFKPCGPEVNAVQVEGIMLALRALRKGPASLRSAYEFLSGSTLERMPDTIEEFVTNILFTLPPARIDIDAVDEFNRIISENIKTAA